MDAEAPRLVGGRGDHAPLAPADHDRTPPQRGVVHLLDGREKGVHVHVHDHGGAVPLHGGGRPPGAGYSALMKLMRSFRILGPSDSQR